MLEVLKRKMSEEDENNKFQFVELKIIRIFANNEMQLLCQKENLQLNKKG